MTFWLENTTPGDNRFGATLVVLLRPEVFGVFGYTQCTYHGCLNNAQLHFIFFNALFFYLMTYVTPSGGESDTYAYCYCYTYSPGDSHAYSNSDANGDSHGYRYSHSAIATATATATATARYCYTTPTSTGTRRQEVRLRQGRGQLRRRGRRPCFPSDQ